MKRKKSFLKRHIIALSILFLVGVYSVYNLYEKQQVLENLEMISEERIEEIRELKHSIQRLEMDLEAVDTLDFVEKYAREKFKMVRPDEVYFQMIYDKDDD